MIVKEPEDKTDEYLLQDNKKTRFGATFIIVVLIVLILAVIATAYFIDWNNEANLIAPFSF